MGQTNRKPISNRELAAKMEAMSDWDRSGHTLWLVHERDGQSIGEYETTGGAAWAFFFENGGPEADPYEHLLSGYDSPRDGDFVYYAAR